MAAQNTKDVSYVKSFFIIKDRIVQTGYKNDIKQLIKFRVAFQLIQCPLEFDVNNTELTQELVNLLNLKFCFEIQVCFEINKLLLQSLIHSTKKA